MRRILCALVVVAPLLVTAPRPALADTEPHAASVAVGRVLGVYESGPSGGLFTAGSPTDCPSSSHGGQCWWWAANAFMALTTYAEENSGTADAASIEADLANTYSVICQTTSGSPTGRCPSTPDRAVGDPFQNHYYDDTGWWEQAWINAYKLTHLDRYLYLAEELWSYVTATGWQDPSSCGFSGVVQFDKGSGDVGALDAFANALYLRTSAWLYSITGEARYMLGAGQGGAFAAAAFIRQHLIYHYNAIALGTAGAAFMVADHVDGSCQTGGAQSWLQSQGEMVNAWSDMYAADKAYCTANPSCGSDPSYYDRLADELALTTIGDRMDSAGSWPYEGQPGQAEPTVDAGGILSEPCEPPDGKPWPGACDLGTSIGDYKPYLISKGIFERGVYCSDHNFNDPALTAFISSNAASLAGLPHFGFLWDSGGANDPVVFATQASILDGLDADLGTSFATC